MAWLPKVRNETAASLTSLKVHSLKSTHRGGGEHHLGVALHQCPWREVHRHRVVLHHSLWGGGGGCGLDNGPGDGEQENK